MLFRLRKYFSIFTLAVFLFPLVVEEVHTYGHRNDFHCTASDTHFHELEHHCTICDYIPYTSDNTFQENTFSFLEIYTTVCFNYYESVAVLNRHFNFSLRGPPTIS